MYLALLPSLPLSASAHQAVEELSQEASELLVLHERFLLALRNSSSLATDGATPIGTIDEVVGKVAGLFIKEACVIIQLTHIVIFTPLRVGFEL